MKHSKINIIKSKCFFIHFKNMLFVFIGFLKQRVSKKQNYCWKVLLLGNVFKQSKVFTTITMCVLHLLTEMKYFTFTGCFATICQ